MLQDIKKENSNFLGYFLVAAAGIGMLFIGLPPLFGAGGGNDPTVVTVNGQKVRLQQYNQTYRDVQNRNPNLPPAQLRELAIRDSVIASLLQQQALNSHYRLPNNALYDVIKQQFGDEKTYQGWLNNRHLNAETYQNAVRKEQTVARYYGFFAPLPAKDDPLFHNYLQALAQTRTYTLFTLPIAPIAAEIIPTPADLEKYYQQQQNHYLTPETVNIAYSIFNAADLSNPAQIPAEDVAKAQQENEKRAGDYLIFDQPSAAEAAEKALKSGEKTFADYQQLIKEKKIAGESGALDLNKKGDGVLPEIDTQLFALSKVGDVSPVFKTDSGVMIIALRQIERPDEATIRQQLAQKNGVARYSELANQAYDAAQNNKPLSAITGITGGKVQQLTDLNADSTAPAWLNNPNVQEQLFGAKAVAVNHMALPVELSPNESLFFTVTKRQLPAPKPLDSIRATVEKDYRADVAAKTLHDKAEKLLQALQNPKADTSPEALAEKYHATVTTPPALNRFLPENQDLSGQLFQSAQRFTLVTRDNGDVAIARLDKVGSIALPAPVAQSQEKIWQMTAAGNFSAALTQWLSARAKVDVNQNLLEKL